MEIGIDSFVATTPEPGSRSTLSPAEHIRNLLEEIAFADEAGLDVFGIGEHHRHEYLDSAPAVILAAAAARTRRIRLTSAVTVLSAADPVRVFQNFATLDLISNGRAEIVVGRGSFIESFPLFGLDIDDYDSLFAEKLDLLLKIREETHVQWSGKHRAALTGQGVYPRPVQNPLPVWLGVGGTPFLIRARGHAGLAAGRCDHRRGTAPVPAAHRSLSGSRPPGGALSRSTEGRHSRVGLRCRHLEDGGGRFFSGLCADFYADWQGARLAADDSQAIRRAARPPPEHLLVGDADRVAGKVLSMSEALGGISRITFQMSVATLPHAKLMRAVGDPWRARGSGHTERDQASGLEANR